MQVDGATMMALANMLRGPADEAKHDPEPKGLPRRPQQQPSGPGSIGGDHRQSKLSDQLRPTATRALKRETKDIWDDDEVAFSQDVGEDPRLVPEYTIKYSQRVSAEDMYLPSSSTTMCKSVHDADSLSIAIELPETRLADVDLEVSQWELNVRTPLYRLQLPLPNPVDDKRGKAVWEKEQARLVRLCDASQAGERLNGFAARALHSRLTGLEATTRRPPPHPAAMNPLAALPTLPATMPVEVIDLDSDSDDVIMLPQLDRTQELRFHAITGLAPVQFVQPSASRSPSPPPLRQGPAGPTSAELYRALVMPESSSTKPKATVHCYSPEVILVDSDSDDCGDEQEVLPGNTCSPTAIGNDQILAVGLGYEHTPDTTTQQGRPRRCDICEIDLPPDQTYAAHNSSIAHLHARSALADALAPPPVPTPVISSSVPADSIGLRLLKMSGWTPGTGLGAESQGRITPIDVHYKNDLKGLGAPTRKIIVGGAGQGPLPGVGLTPPTKEQAASIKAREAARLADERERQRILAYLKN
ncbi:Protein pih1d3 [Geranomyces variabilis]|uniref:Protein pih1d3 n=1 Tax=Geranomyces variabilis TaxID=109894 RepID=A0AAD5XS19_9FUNG|nr:Protein pih1d3 [Geranomyces variabilis]